MALPLLLVLVDSPHPTPEAKHHSLLNGLTEAGCQTRYSTPECPCLPVSVSVKLPLPVSGNLWEVAER